jgi:hypothetical protein
MKKLLFILLFTNLAFAGSGRILDSNDNPYYITSIYDGNDLRGIQYVQSNDVMYLVHKDYPPQKLTRFDHDDWSMGAVEWKWGPFLEENTTEVTIRPNFSYSGGKSDYYDTGDDSSLEIYYAPYIKKRWYGQTFTATNSYDVNQIGLKVYAFDDDDSGTLHVRLRATSAGLPTGADIASSSASVSEFTSNNNGEWYYFDFDSPVSIVAGTQYAILAEANFDNDLYIRADSSSPTYNGGTSIYSHTPGTETWKIDSTKDLMFKVIDVNNVTVVSETGTLIASGDIFDPNHVGSIWKLSQKTLYNTIEVTLDEDDEASESLYVYGDYLLNLKGTWNGKVILEKSNNNIDWVTVYIVNHSTSYYDDIDYSASESEEGYSYRIIFDDWTSGSVLCSFVAYNKYVSGYARITGYVDANEVTVQKIIPFANNEPTTKWSEGAWSNYRGYPRAICFYQNRLCLAGTYHQPNTLWCSKSADYENMQITGLDDGAIDYTVSSAKQNPIMWLQDAKSLIAGTSGSIISIGSQSATSTLTASSIGSQRQTETGSGSIQAALTDSSIIYVDRNYKKIRDISYNVQSDGLVSPDLTIFSDNITEPNILEMAWQSRPDNIGWFVKGDGNMVTLTYNPAEGVSALSEISTDGNFVSVCVIPGVDEDEVWVAVERDSSDSILIEKFHNQDWTSDVWFVDSGLEYDGSETSILTGAGHLEGKTVQIYTDANGYIGDYTVSDSNIVLDVNVVQAIAGLGYTSRIKTFPIEVGYDGGTSIGVRKNIRRIVLGLYESEGGRYGFEQMYDILYPPYSTEFYTGITTRLNFMSGYRDEVFIIIDQNEPLPLGLTSISLVDLEVGNAN